jgi:hypothetical protein
MTLAQFSALTAVIATTDHQADALAKIMAIVPATAQRLGVTIEQVYAMPAADAVRAIADTVPVIATVEAFGELAGLGAVVAEAFAADALAAKIGESVRG